MHFNDLSDNLTVRFRPSFTGIPRIIYLTIYLHSAREPLNREGSRLLFFHLFSSPFILPYCSPFIYLYNSFLHFRSINGIKLAEIFLIELNIYLHYFEV